MNRTRLFIYVSTLFTAYLLFACGRPSSRDLLSEAERFLDSDPDSAAWILEEQIVPSSLKDSAVKADYGWQIAMLHEKQGRSLVNDSLIEYSVRYYKEHNLPRLLPAYLLAIKRRLLYQENDPDVVRFCEEAVREGERLKDTLALSDLYGIMASVYGKFNDRERAMAAYRQLMKLSEKERIDGLYNSALLLAKMGEVDTALLYMREAVNLACQKGSEYEFHYVRNYANFLSSVNRPEESMQVLDSLLIRFPEEREAFVVDYSNIYNRFLVGELDSARKNLDLMEDKARQVGAKDVSFQSMSLLFRLLFDVKEGRPVNLMSFGQFNDSVSWEIRKASITEKERIFAQNKLIRDNLRLEIEKGDLQKQILCGLLVLVIGIAVLVYSYQRKLLAKERNLEQIKEQLHSHVASVEVNERLIRENDEMIRSLSTQLETEQTEARPIQEENERLREQNIVLREEIDTYVKDLFAKGVGLGKLSSRLVDQEKVLKRLRDQEIRLWSDIRWPEVYAAMDRLFDGYTGRLRRTFPNLTEEDIQCCCLIRLQLSTSAIAQLYSIAPSSFTKRKQRIKERMSQSKPDVLSNQSSLDVYLWGF